jgi:rfaE bifunctional protein nucleotidyltransferase chain/domain
MLKRKWLEQKLVEPENLGAKIAALRGEKFSIATLHGSFDLLHAGHLFMLYEASLQADKLIVALNTDASIRKYKGQERPIIPLEQRLEMMAAIEFVDYLTFFDETEPIQIIEKIKTDFKVK